MVRSLSLCSVGLLAVALLTGTLRAAQEGHGAVAGESQHSTKVEAMIHTGEGEELRTFDLSNPAELKEFTGFLRRAR